MARVKKTPAKQSQSTRVLNSFSDWCITLQSSEGRGYASFPSNGNAVTFPIDSREFRGFLLNRVAEVFGEALNPNALTTIIRTLEARAMEIGERVERPVEQSSDGKRKTSDANRLLELVSDLDISFFHTSDRETYVRYPANGRQALEPLQGEVFEGYLATKFYKRTGKVIGASALSDTLRLLQHYAMTEGERKQVNVRIAGDCCSSVYIDLGDDSRQSVEIDDTGYHLVNSPPVLFRRPSGMLALPAPTSGGSIDTLRPFLNVGSEDDFRLLVGFLIACLHPAGPYPILVLQGEQGCSKSTSSRVLRRLIDPNDADLRGMTEGDNLTVAARNSRVVVLDNLSHVSNELSDQLCRLSTGGGSSKRKLYTGTEEDLFKEVRPLIINGIPSLVRLGDLRDRAIRVELPALSPDRRLPERQFWSQFKEARPAILGALYDGVSVALPRLGTIDLPGKPRMADVAEWVEAASPAFGWQQGDFTRLLCTRQEEQALDALSDDTFTTALRAFGEPRPKEWEGTPAELLRELNRLVPDDERRSKDWPQNARAVKNCLDRKAPELRKIGIFYETGERGTGERTVKLTFRANGPYVGGTPAGAPRDERQERQVPCGDEPAGKALITHESELMACVAALQSADVIALDIETTGLSPRQDRVRLLSLATAAGSWVIDCFQTDPRPLFSTLSGKRLIGHNLKFDLGFLWELGLVPGEVADTMLLSQVFYAGTEQPKGFHSLGSCVQRELGVALDKEHQKSDWSDDLTPAMIDYAAKDAAILLPLEKALRSKIEAVRLEQAASIEEHALPAVLWMERAGIGFDLAAWREQLAEAIEEEGRLRNALDTAALPRCVNWNSPKQVKELFAERGFALEKTDDPSLAACALPLADQLRQYRAAKKRVSSYGEEWLDKAENGRLFVNWSQARAATGRMACSEPNVQQVPREGKYRRCFVAPPGRVLIKADYSAIELRIAAKVTGERRMLEAFQQGQDLHKLTASLILGKPLAEVSKDERQMAKAVNFGLIYGMSANGLASYARSGYGVTLSQEEAARYRDSFFRAYPGVADWHRQTKRERAGEVRTLTGRRRLLDDDTPDTKRLNTPVQGTGADGLKMALALLWETRSQFPTAFPVIACHDEVVVEADEQDAEAVAEWLQSTMVEGMSPLIAPVPVEVETQIAATWGGG